MNHPAGRIGKRLTLRVADVMVAFSQLPLAGAAVTVMDALTELTGKGFGCVLVVADSDDPTSCAPTSL